MIQGTLVAPEYLTLIVNTDNHPRSIDTLVAPEY
jgi:hypothetical protein